MIILLCDRPLLHYSTVTYVALVFFCMPISLHIREYQKVFELGNDGFCSRELMEAGQSQNQKNHHLNQNPS